jgi:UPF0755 protein
VRSGLIAVAVLLSVITVLFWALWFGEQWLQRWWLQPFGAQRSVVVEVAAGESTASVAAALAEKKILQRPVLWRVMARRLGLDNRIKSGEYRFDLPLQPAQVLEQLVSGRVLHYQVTLPEGITLRRALELLAAQEALATTLSGPNDPRLLAMVEPYSNAEGWFFPDTYSFTRGQSDLQIMQRAHQRMRQMLERYWAAKAPDLPYQRPYEALIMASIVERETGLGSERPVIAGVFVRRLQTRMRLQTDPTVIYGLGADFDGNLRRSHLRDAENVYNSYRHHGLPPTPIALPGEAALRAALQPAPGTALYFVARGDGSHKFSDTLEQHRAAVDNWQRQRVPNYRSAPPVGDNRQ